MTAIIHRNKKISYKKLLEIIDEYQIDDPIFPVTKTLDCVIKILTCLIKGIPFFPYSPHLQTKPKVQIPNDCDFILHTSGSSKMKYALFKKEALLLSNLFTHDAFKLKEGDVYLLNLPLYHTAGLSLLMRSFLRGACIAINPQDLSAITHISIVPAMAKELGPYPNLKALLVGGNFISKELADSLIYQGYPLYITYGMTEMSSHIFVEKYIGEIFFTKPLWGRKISFDSDGVLMVSGIGKFHRYLDQAAYEVHNTNDIFSNKDGKLIVERRKDNMFISGGENIHPEEIAKAIMLHPKVHNVEIKIIPHLKWGQRPLAKISADSLSKDEVYNFLLDKLEKFKIPKLHEMIIEHGEVFAHDS